MITVGSLFSEIGAFEKALQNQDIPYDLKFYCEFDKYAAKSYSLIHDEPESKNLGDITKIDVASLPQVDLITYGFPCQDISLAGKQKGLFNEDGSQTRSGLFFNAVEIIKHCRPKVAIAENVKNLTSKKFEEQFQLVLDSLDEAGYNNYWKVLKSSDYGIPQKRERVFIVSIRKDLDTSVFEFPEPYELKVKLKDLCDKEVDEKYYLSDKMVNYVLDMKGTQQGSTWENSINNAILNPDVAKTLACRSVGGQQRANISNFIIEGLGCEMTVGEFKKIFTPVLGKTKNGYIVRNANSKGYDIAEVGDSIDLENPRSATRRARVGHGVCQTLNCLDWKTIVTDEPMRIRKLTSKECFRLQGFDDCDHDACAKGGISESQLYKMAGNSITVDVVEELFCMLFDEDGEFYI